MFVDTHVHLNDRRLYENLEEVIAEANDAGVGLMVCIGYDKVSSQLALEIAKKYPGVYAALGFHPSDIKGITDEDYQWLEEQAEHEKVVALGEIGLDYYWNKDNKEAQAQAFERQLAIAAKLQKPVVIHMREASQDTYQILKKHYDKIPGGVMHAYSGSAEMAHEFVKLNLLIGVGGVVTFKNGQKLKEVVQELDAKHLVTETDAPYLTPVPYRGKTNYPKYIPLIASEIAEIKNMSLDELMNQILTNTKILFNIK